MEKSALTPDPIRDAPKGHGEGQSPGAVSIMPGRSTRDLRFVQYPMTFFILSYACSHASAYTACFWVNQGTIARTLNISQQAVSQHFNKLIAWGYIEKLRKEAPSRPYGKKGAIWRVVYDPRMSWEQVVANTPEPEKTVEQMAKEATKTIDLADRGPRGHLTKPRFKPVDKSAKPVDKSKTTQAPACKTASISDDEYKVQLVQTNKPQLVHNYYKELDNKESIDEGICRRMCAAYTRIVQERYGRAWTYDGRQMELAAELIRMGYTAETFTTDARGVVRWLAKKNKQAPQSLQYFITRKLNDSKPKDVEGIVKHMASKMRMT